RKWREHLYEMDYLKEGIGLRAMAQRDPLVEYQREGYNLFEAMNEAIKEEAVGFLFNAEVQVQEPEPAPLQPVAIGDMLRGLDAAPADQRQPQDPALEAASAAARPEVHAKGLDEIVRPSRLHYSAPSADGGVEEHDEGSAAPELSDAQLAGARRNDPCPCGSGKKFKMCHGKGA
ncbi:SEC-C metal-binding domain-containing protein, partial [Nostocoides australiense]|nr:SEC-C metal-binding domain-containing protein [Tetrasphaera australiensis]HRW02857.1 SEC-C metal-binding domain-containing protein [Tetrasphaera sp.]